MSDVEKMIDQYITVWNETDPAARRAGVAQVWDADGTYTDPLAAVQGHDAIDALIAAVQAQFPGFAFRLAGTVDAHHDVARFGWHLGPRGDAESVVDGFDVVTLAEDGRIRHVYGFLDKVPTT
ncbi:isomerase [Sphaerisporangium krabiense]|uniref:SnoaL-like domain-containing protein n=1 Tax=Sphaerisporangium krabiense TaxID=763782 RepID=A0A7W9DU28_9ACTN|nr:nuclear transport factor 2 family protein [Sphaerisporangium krabiense]MBB5631251.1 hypothetical protein [Sphaerisporangium krabiense]GII61136.1 isomerase [Sphaerisporangium krabiense]